MAPTIKLSPEKVQIFLAHLSKIEQRKKTAEKLKEDLSKQIDKIKSLPIEKPQQKAKLDKEMAKLEDKIEEVVRIEKELAIEAKREKMVTSRLQRKMDEMDDKIAAYMKARDERLRRVEELERKIRLKIAGESEELDIIENQLMKMEERYEEMKKEKKHDEDALLSMKQKIDSLKRVLRRMRQ